MYAIKYVYTHAVRGGAYWVCMPVYVTVCAYFECMRVCALMWVGVCASCECMRVLLVSICACAASSLGMPWYLLTVENADLHPSRQQDMVGSTGKLASSSDLDRSLTFGDVAGVDHAKSQVQVGTTSVICYSTANVEVDKCCSVGGLCSTVVGVLHGLGSRTVHHSIISAEQYSSGGY